MSIQNGKEIIIPVTGLDIEKKEQDENKSLAVPDAENEHIEMLKRLQAEFSNYKNRVEREKAEISNWSKGEFIKKLLPVIDDLERMQMYGHDISSDSRKEGIDLIYKNMYRIFLDEGLEEINAEGEVFNPEIHEAVGVENTEMDRDGKVVEVWQKGYTFKGRLLRPSKVKVGRCLEN